MHAMSIIDCFTASIKARRFISREDASYSFDAQIDDFISRNLRAVAASTQSTATILSRLASEL
jgi:hypothetical protein